MLTVAKMNVGFHELLRRVQQRRPDLIKPDVDVEEEYSVRRSLRRGSNTQSLNVTGDTALAEAMCRWRKVERARGKQPAYTIIETYTECRLAMNYLLKYYRPL